VNEAEPSEEPTHRVPTGCTGLDTVLHGGWLRGGTCRVTGSPGTGKTLRAVFHTLLDKMLAGGPWETSSTLLLGTPGSGKTLPGPRFPARGAREGEIRLLLGPGLEPKLEGVEATVDNLVFLRYVEPRSQLYWMLSILKMFSIPTQGIDVAETFKSVESILTGQARPLDVKKKPHPRKKLDRRTPVHKRSRA
jgi:hypothetical protein